MIFGSTPKLVGLEDDPAGPFGTLAIFQGYPAVTQLWMG